ncbi:MAG: DUF2723 domain-containing protein [Kiritimatiellae bacterium]|nr:DUF2723 domain-containing protein [Kiritimatiellia bacterium]
MSRWHIGNSRQTARWLTLGVALAAFLVYRATLHPAFFPGESSRWVAIFLGIESFAKPQYLLWRLVGAAAAHLPLGILPDRMNLLSAVAGACCIALLFAIVRSVTLLLCFHATTLSARRRKHAGVLAGLVAGAALGTSVPFWLAATRCMPQTFELLLLLMMGWLLVRTATSGSEAYVALFGFLLGISVLEWDTGLRMSPLMLFLAWRALRMGQMCDARGYAALAGGVMTGVLAYLLVAWLGSQWGWLAPGSFISPLRGLVTMGKAQYTLVVRGGWRSDPRMLAVMFFAVLPWLATCALAIWRSDRSATSSSGLLSLVLAGTTMVAAIGVTISPWGVYRTASDSELPCTVYLLVALVAAHLAGNGCILAGGRCWPDMTNRRLRPPHGDDEIILSYADAAVGRLMFWFAAVLIAVMALVNAGEVRAWREPMASRVAVAVVQRVPQQSWLVSDVPVNRLIRLYARMAGRDVNLLNERTERISAGMLSRAQAKVSRHAAFAGLDQAALHNALATNAVTFVRTWMTIDPHVQDKLTVLSSASLWEESGLTAVPDAVLYRGARDRGAIDLDALLTSHEQVWQEIESLPPVGVRTPAWLRGQRAQLRQHLHDVGVRLAALLAGAGRGEEADAVIARMRRLREEPEAPWRESF